MKCQLKISPYCEKVFRKDKVKYIDGKACCDYCFQKRKDENKIIKITRKKPKSNVKVDLRSSGFQRKKR